MKNKTFAYARISSKDQNEARQLVALQEYVADERDIYVDKQSGKDFNRPEYQRMIANLREGDTLIILSIDRLGRNYDEIRNEWRRITVELKANVKVLDMPLLDTTKGEGLDGKFIADLTLQILSYVAEKERINIKRRQREGIDVMPRDEQGRRVSVRKGVTYGRKPNALPENFDNVIALWKAGEITAVEAMRRTGVRKTSFYKIVKQNES